MSQLAAAASILLPCTKVPCWVSGRWLLLLLKCTTGRGHQDFFRCLAWADFYDQTILIYKCFSIYTNLYAPLSMKPLVFHLLLWGTAGCAVLCCLLGLSCCVVLLCVVLHTAGCFVWCCPASLEAPAPLHTGFFRNMFHMDHFSKNH